MGVLSAAQHLSSLTNSSSVLVRRPSGNSPSLPFHRLVASPHTVQLVSKYCGRWLVYILILLPAFCSRTQLCNCSAAIYTVYTSPTHPPIPNHLPTLIVTPHGAFRFACYLVHFSIKLTDTATGQPANILYSYLHTNYVRSNSPLLCQSTHCQ